MLIPLNSTVTRRTQDGMPVKSMLVPEVDATAVPDTMLELRPLTATVPVPAGKVSVPFVAVLGSCRVTLPPPLELSFTLMAYSYKMLMVPASKVSEPLVACMRSRSTVPAIVIDPEA